MKTPETDNRPAENAPRPVLLIVWILTVVAGYFLTRDLCHEPVYQILPPKVDRFMFFGPAILLVGLAALLAESLRRVRDTKQGAKVIGMLLKGLRILGIAMVLVGGDPWLWLSELTRLHGGRPGNEGDGMAGFLIFLFIGMPGLLLTLLSFAIKIPVPKAPDQTRVKSDD